jgi:hypothetical protein
LVDVEEWAGPKKNRKNLGGFMKKLVLLVLLSPLAFALGEKTFTFTPPTQYTDGSALPNAMIASYDIECDGGLLVNLPNVPLMTDRYEAPPGTFTVGDHACRAFTVTTEGARSGPSNTVNFTVAPGVPAEGFV